MNAHIINCDEKSFLEYYLSNGYIGVGLPIKKTSAKGLSNACTTTYSMYADMKTVFPGDIIFIHAGNYIYGVFKAESTFKEKSSVNKMFLSPNIHYYPKPNNPNSGWKVFVGSSLPDFSIDYRQLSISHFVDDCGRNVCFEKGFYANEVFDLKRKGKIWSIPERWKYPDTARCVRPLMLLETKELIKLLDRDNSDTSKRITIIPKNLDNFLDIQLILDPNIVEDEKIIEAWLCENLRTSVAQKIFGEIASFGNNVQMGYLQGIDIFGHCKGTLGISKYKIIEVKRGNANFPDDVQQILQYMDWVIEHLSSGNPKAAEGYMVAKSFNGDCKDYVRNHNKVNIGRRLSLIKFDYDAPRYTALKIQRII